MIEHLRTLLGAALFYALLGWPVLPLHSVGPGGACTCHLGRSCPSPAKHPRTAHGVKDASTDPDQIRRFWERWPDANIGIRTGPESGLLVLDIDPRHGGDKSIKQVAEQLGLDSPKVWAETGGGGQHVIYACPAVPVPSRANIGGLPGVDTRVKGAYFVGSPSVHASGRRYEWGDDFDLSQLEPVPRGLLAIMLSTGERGSSELASASSSSLIREGSRNDTLFEMAASLRGRGAVRDEILLELHEANTRLCRPPLSEEEVVKIATSAASYPAGVRIGGLTISPFSDLANAKRLARGHGHDLRYNHPTDTWFIWDGQRWARDDSGEITRRAKATIVTIHEHALRQSSRARRKALSKHAARSESAARLDAMVKVARSEPGAQISLSDLDTHPLLFNVGNGTLDLATGKLRPHDRGDLLSKIAPVDYDPDARCPIWDQFIDRITGQRPALARYLQKVAGYGLTGETSEQCMFFLHGAGGNGKTTLIETILSVLGDYGATADFDLLISRNWAGGPRNDIARLAGKRLVAAVEPEFGGGLSEVILKRLTGGDTITARPLYQESFEFKPSFKIVIATNHLPPISGSDNAVWRRIRVIPLNITIPPDERDPKLQEKLRRELPGILNWMLEGTRLNRQEGLGNPPTDVADATFQFRDKVDSVGAFLAACCIPDAGAKVSTGDLHAAYVHWCEDAGRVPVSKTALALDLTTRGITQTTGTGGKRLRAGIRLRTDSDT